MRPWHLRLTRGMVYVCAILALDGMAVSCRMDAASPAEAWIAARQLFGLWALGLLLAAMLIGPLTFILPWLPLRAHLALARRAVGVSAFLFGFAHFLAYILPVVSRNWRDIYAPGTLWILGLVLGLLILVGMGAMAFTSRDKAVVKMGGKKWKRLHGLVYVMLPVALLHAVCVGADFGVNRGLDVKTEPDMGALFGFLALSVAWLALFVCRRRGIRWRHGSGGKTAP